MLDHLPALVALTCPSFNSYRRLQPQSWSSAYTAWGHDNREAAVRVASPFWSDREGSTNLELKAADSSCNPYIALGGLLAAGLSKDLVTWETPALPRSPKSLKDPALEKLQELRRTDNLTNWYYLARTYLYLALVIGGTVWFYQYRSGRGWSFCGTCR